MMLSLHRHVMTCIHYVIVIDERGKMQYEQSGLVTCPEFEQDGFRV